MTVLSAQVALTSSQTSKLEAIDMSQPFPWYDDRPLQFEIHELEECGLLDNLIQVDLRRKPTQLRHLP
jgi:hypothetical protein